MGEFRWEFFCTFFPFLSFFLQLCINNEAFITIKGSFVGFSRFFYVLFYFLLLTRLLLV